MNSDKNEGEDFLKDLPDERRKAMEKLRQVISGKLPQGYEESIEDQMIHYVVPHTLYPSGYHCNPDQPLPFISLSSQKNNISLYHMGLYVSPELVDWLKTEYPKHSKLKLDMGKNCIRFKKMDQIPYDLIGELCTKMTPEEWIVLYEAGLKK